MPTPPAEDRLGLAGLVATAGYARLLGLRFAAQWGDGMFQPALGGALLFNPERQAEAQALSGALTVPITVVTKDDDSQEVVVGYNLSRLAPAIA